MNLVEISEIEQMLKDIEDRAERLVVKIDDRIILKEDLPKYEALTTLRTFINDNQNVLSTLTSLAKNAGVNMGGIVSSFDSQVAQIDNSMNISQSPEVDNPTIVAPTAPEAEVSVEPEVAVAPVVPAPVAVVSEEPAATEEDVKKKDGASDEQVTEEETAQIGEAIVGESEDKGYGYSFDTNFGPSIINNETVTEAMSEEFGNADLSDNAKLPEAPVQATPDNVNNVDVEEPSFEYPQNIELINNESITEAMSEDFDNDVTKEGNPNAYSFTVEPIDNDVAPEAEPYVYKPMTDEEIAASQAKIAESDPIPEPEPEQAPIGLPAHNEVVTVRKVVGRRLQQWKNSALRYATCLAVISLGENVIERTKEYAMLYKKIGQLQYNARNYVDRPGELATEIDAIQKEINDTQGLEFKEKRRLNTKLRKVQKTLDRCIARKETMQNINNIANAVAGEIVNDSYRVR